LNSVGQAISETFFQIATPTMGNSMSQVQTMY
jgi:hypothetical protein